MRRLLCAGAIAALFVVSAASHDAKAEIVVRISRATQTMEVIGRRQCRATPGRFRPAGGACRTPGGVYHPQSLARSWFSSRYHNSPMPHSIFFRGGVAIHGTYETARLGGPASHGCVRLDPAHATELYGLVRQEGMGATTIVVH